jgi:hypothetical protein
MAIRSLKTGSFSRSTQVGNPIILPGDYESIATVTVGAGGSSSISFSSIPQTYTHLQVRATSLAPALTSGLLYFNGGAGTYAWHELKGNGATASATAGTSTNILYNTYNQSSTASYTGGAIIDILDYTNTNKNKTIRVLSGSDANGSGSVFLRSGFSTDTSAITALGFIVSGGGNWAQYSSFALYGVK